MISGRSYGRGDIEDHDYSNGLCRKKPKHNNVGRKKVPRRGPGVAELEKIRLEEQHISTSTSLPSPPPPFPEKKSPPVILPAATNRRGPVYPFSSYFPPGNFPDDLIPPAPVFQRKHDSSLHYLPPMNLPNLGSGGLYQFIEPPSNQTSCIDNVYHFLDQEKIMVSAKRPWSSITENTTKCSVGPTLTHLRDGKQIKSLDIRLKNHVQDSGTTVRNPIAIDSLSASNFTTPILASSSLDFPRFFQKEEFDHESMPRRSDINHSLNRKPFYSFIPSNEQSIRDQDSSSFNMKNKRYESYDTANDHNIDLRLKL